MTQRSRSIADCFLLGTCCGFLFFFGLGYFGLVGADEPRYAQIAREMLARHDWITPTLGGKPWLEKPVLYYWQAMLAYSLFGVSDWAARLGSAVDATLMAMGAYVFLRRIRPGSRDAGLQLDGVLFTVSALGVVGFARAASTDMPLAAMFTLSLLAWYLWRESGKRFYLGWFYGFLGLGTLAKGPVAPALAAAIIVVFALATRDGRTLRGTLWLPGLLLFSVVTLPWYVAVELRNPEFFHVFILQHNLARFGTNLYHHSQPFWYYLPVVLFALLPWVIFLVPAFFEGVQRWWRNRNQATAAENGLSLFLLIWLVLPLLFFSISQSKLPGYILPALPAGTLLLADYVRDKAANDQRPRTLVVVLHALVSALPVIPALMIHCVVLQHRVPWGRPLLVSCGVALALAVVTSTILKSAGLRRLGSATLIPVGLTIGLVLRLGAPVLDKTLSARPLASELSRIENSFARPPLPIAILRLSREDQYGLQFYLDREIPRYEWGEIPAQEHVVVVPRELEDRVIKRAQGRVVVHLGTSRVRALEYFWVSSAAAGSHWSTPGDRGR